MCTVCSVRYANRNLKTLAIKAVQLCCTINTQQVKGIYRATGEGVKMDRIAAYIRFSKSIQAKDESIESLLFQVRKAVEAIGGRFEDCQIFRDVMSGKRNDRPGFQFLLAAIRSKSVDIVVVRGDRLSRDVGASSELAKMLEKYEVRFWDILKSRFIDFGNPEDWADYHRAAVDHEKESRTISKRIKLRKEFARHQGKVQGGRMPLGYRRSTEGLYEVDPATKDAALRIFELFIETRSPVATSRIIKEEFDIDMSYQAVRKMVVKPCYRGHTGYMQIRSIDKKKQNANKHEDLEFSVIVPNTHEALISNSIWQQVQEVLSENKKRRGRTKLFPCLPLSGLTFCANCGATGQICTRKRKSGIPTGIIYCSDHRKGKDGIGCGKRSFVEQGNTGKMGKIGLNIEIAEEAVIKALCDRAKALAQSVIDTPDDDLGVSEEQLKVEAQIAQIEGLIKSIGDESGLLRQKINELRSQIPSVQHSKQENIEELRSVLVQFYSEPEMWRILSPEHRKTLFRQFVNRVVFDRFTVIRVELMV